MKKWLKFSCGILLVFCLIYAEQRLTCGQEKELEIQTEELPQTDYSELDEAMEEALGTDKLSFKELAEGLASGKFRLNMEFLKELLERGVFGDLNGAGKVLSQILVLAILSALFTMISSVFGNAQVSDISFYVVFLILLVLLVSSFGRASQTALGTIEKLLMFVKVMMPAYMLIVAAAGGGTTAVIFYEFFLFLVFVVDWLVVRLLIPLIHVYVVLGVVNHISKEDLFSKTAGLIKTLIQWFLKTVIGLVIGFQLIQGLVAPFIDSFKSAAIHKTLMSIPGVGNAINGVTEMAIGAAILIKNGMGAAALIVLVLICLAPVVNLGGYVLLFQFSGALIQPVADKRIQKCVGYVREGTSLLMRTLMITCFLFLLTVAVLTASTNGGMG